MSTVCRLKKRYLLHHARVALGPVASFAAGQCRRRLLPLRRSSSSTVWMQKGLSAVVSGCPSLSRCPTQTQRSGANLESPKRRRWWSSRIGGAGSMPLGYIILLSGKGEPTRVFFSIFACFLRRFWGLHDDDNDDVVTPHSRT